MRLSLYTDGDFCQAVNLPDEVVLFMYDDLVGQARENIVMVAANGDPVNDDISVYESRRNVGMVFCAVVLTNKTSQAHQACGWCGSTAGTYDLDWPRCLDCGGC